MMCFTSFVVFGQSCPTGLSVYMPVRPSITDISRCDSDRGSGFSIDSER